MPEGVGIKIIASRERRPSIAINRNLLHQVDKNLPLEHTVLFLSLTYAV